MSRAFACGLAFIAVAPLIATAGELQWRSGRAAMKSARPSAVSTTIERTPARGSDAPLQPAALETAGELQFASNANDNEPIRSVVVPLDEASNSYRSAQLPAAEPGTASGEDAAEAESQDAESDNLFEPMPSDLPPFDAPLDFDEPAQSERAPLRMESEQEQPSESRGPIPGTPFRPAPLDTTMPPGPLPATTPTPAVGTMQEERRKAAAACEEGVLDLQSKTIDTLNLSIAVTGDEGADFPFECALDESWHDGRCWEQTTYMWKASALCHKPLYFEDEQLERYGHSWPPCCQPLVSGAHFFTRLPILPYCMGVEPPNECIYALGHYRPGNCAPYMCSPVPLSFRGALFQAGAVVGVAAALP